jgi:hypothetical protein
MLCGYYYIGGVDTFHIPSVPNKILVFDNRSGSSFDGESHLVGGTSISVDSFAKRTGGNRGRLSIDRIFGKFL